MEVWPLGEASKPGAGPYRPRPPSGELPTWVRSCRRPARGGNPAGLPPGREAFRASRSWRARPLGSCLRRAWAGGAGGHAPVGQPAGGDSHSLDPPPGGLPHSSVSPIPSSWAPALSAAGTLSLGPGGRSLGFPPDGKARDAWRRPAGAMDEVATPAAEITVGKVERRHEFLHPLQRSAPVLQGRRRRHRRALSPLPGRPQTLPARSTAWNQRFRRPKGAFQARTAFLGTPAAV